MHRAAVAEAVDVVYKQGRKPMPDLLREQFPHFRPIVEAFGYRNLEFEGWEADDVIATIATLADEAGVKTCVVSTDRDAFQLCSANVTLMMTPRGVSDVNVYTPERVELRYGVRPDQVPDFIGLKGDTSDNIPGIPGIGDKTAGQLIAQYGSLEEVIAHADDLSPARGKAVREHADQARASKELATMRRDLPLDVDPTTLVSGSPDRSQLKEMFRRFEFRGLLNRVDELDTALPAQDRPKLEGQAVAWRETLFGATRGRVGVAIEDGRIAVASDDGVDVSGWDPSQAALLRDAELVAHDAKALHLPFAPVDDTMIAAYLIEPGRSAYLLDELAAEYGLELEPEPAAEESTAALVRHAEAPRRLAGLMRERLVERGSLELYEQIELPLTAVLAAMEDAGVKIDTYRMGEITARLKDRVEELEALATSLADEEFMIGSTQQVARILFEKLELAPGRKGKTGYSTDSRVLRGLRDAHEIVPVIEEWREYSKLLNTYLLPLPSLISERDGRLHTTFNQAVAATGRLSTTNPNLQSIPVRTPLGRQIRSAFIAEEGHRLLSADYSQVELRILAHVSGEPVLREAFERGEDIHTRTAAEVLGKDPATLTRSERDVAKMVNFGIIYGISSFGLSENLEIPREEAQAYIDTYLARFPRVQEFIARTIARGRGRRVRDDAARPPPPDPGASGLEPPDALARRAARRQHGHAGHGRRRDQGRDDPRPRPPPRRGPERAPRAAGARRAAARGARHRDHGASGSSCGPRWSAPTRSIRRSRSTSASATTGRTRRTEPAAKQVRVFDVLAAALRADPEAWEHFGSPVACAGLADEPSSRAYALRVAASVPPLGMPL